MKLRELEPSFLRRISDTSFMETDVLSGADGVMFKCPKCFVDKGNTVIGVHSIICWQPNVPQTTHPTPGRWSMSGTGYDDLTLTAGSSSILLTPPSCGAHFFITDGEIR